MSVPRDLPFDPSREVREARGDGRPLVALESTVISHGLPWPDNLACARALEAAVRQAGAVPATLAVMDGRVKIGLEEYELQRLAREGAQKASCRDLATLIAAGSTGATTVAATVRLARLAGIAVFATGGLGGVHREVLESFDESADLTELARNRVLVVCAGAKSLLDLPRTLERLETLGVPVLGYGTDRFPAFFCTDSGLPVPGRVDTPQAAAQVFAAQCALDLPQGIVVAQPPPPRLALPRADVEAWLAQASAMAREAGVQGKALTPFLLKRLTELSGGRTLEVNLALIEANAALAGQIAVALHFCGYAC